jgi:hypothetical protein
VTSTHQRKYFALNKDPLYVAQRRSIYKHSGNRVGQTGLQIVGPSRAQIDTEEYGCADRAKAPIENSRNSGDPYSTTSGKMHPRSCPLQVGYR